MNQPRSEAAHTTLGLVSFKQYSYATYANVVLLFIADMFSNLFGVMVATDQTTTDSRLFVLILFLFSVTSFRVS